MNINRNKPKIPSKIILASEIEIGDVAVGNPASYLGGPVSNHGLESDYY
jgi:hypothetical protein